MGANLRRPISDAVYFRIDPTLLRPSRLAGVAWIGRHARLYAQSLSATDLDLPA